MESARDLDSLVACHRAFWMCGPTDRPLIQVTCSDYVLPELLASTLPDGELSPEDIDPNAMLTEYDRVAAARTLIGDDTIGIAEPLLGIPWLEAICGCRVMVAKGKSIWPEQPHSSSDIREIMFSKTNAWFRKLLQVLQVLVEYVGGRYAISISHMRGPSDVLIALLGSDRFLMSLIDDPAHLDHLARQAAEVWLKVVQAQTRIVPPFRGGYGIRQFGLWAPERVVWLQDDTSCMMSLNHYRQFFLKPMHSMSVFPYGVLHLHIPSLHLAETLVSVPNVRAVNLYFDSPGATLADTYPLLRRLQSRQVPLILAKTVEEGFSWDEYCEIAANLSSRGLAVHLRAASVEEGCAVMDLVRRKTPELVRQW